MDTGYIERDREYQRQYYLARREQKIAYARARYNEKRDIINGRRRNRRIAKGLSVREKPALSRKTNSEKEYNALYHTERRSREFFCLKIAALQKVSGLRRPVCCKCGCDDILVLTINHIKGNGRKDLSDLGVGAIKFREKIISGERSISDLDVRCCNCNLRYEYERGRFRLPHDWETIVRQLTRAKSDVPI